TQCSAAGEGGAMGAGGDPQSNQTSVHLEEHVCTALRGKMNPQGPLYFWGTSAVPPEGAGRGGTRVPKPRGGHCG
ncbi:MAG: hypothetical protein ACE5HV_15815, partial [Acidobacteriota bacterium]